MDEKTVIKVRLDEVENKIMFIMKKLNSLQTNIENLQAAIFKRNGKCKYLISRRKRFIKAVYRLFLKGYCHEKRLQS